MVSRIEPADIMGSSVHVRPVFLGVQMDDTSTTGLLADTKGRELGHIALGPAAAHGAQDHLRKVAASFPQPDAIGIGISEHWLPQNLEAVKCAAALVWPEVPCQVSSNLETALLALPASLREGTSCVLVLAGKDSVCYGRSPSGRVHTTGGWGVPFDLPTCSGVVTAALRHIFAAYETTGRWPKLGRSLLAALQLNTPRDLAAWVQRAGASDFAMLVPVLTAAWTGRDPFVVRLMRHAAAELAHSAARCARRVAPPPDRALFVLAGALLLYHERFAAAVRRAILRQYPQAAFPELTRETVWGAVEIARRAFASVRSSSMAGQTVCKRRQHPVARSVRLSPTELRHPKSTRLDRMPLRRAIQLMLAEDRVISAALSKVSVKIAQAVRLIAQRLRNGGRLFYVGAGTSGRLGVLDAAECPPTFHTDPTLVQGIIAGGQSALWRSVEGAEDDQNAGVEAIDSRCVGSKDVVVGIAASGTTPFVWGALQEAKSRRAGTVLICFNPHLRISRPARPNIVLKLDIGPEILTGSTRLKSGTATKLLLNIFSTLCMVKLGKVQSNLMIDVVPSNTKLKQRAVRIVTQLAGSSSEEARRLLEKYRWNVKSALASLKSLPKQPSLLKNE